MKLLLLGSGGREHALAWKIAWGLVDSFEWQAVLTGLLGLFLLLGFYAALGLFMSTLTTYQIVAALGMLVMLAFLGVISEVGQEYALIMPFIGMVLVFIWPVINNIIMKFGSIIANLNILGVFLYGFLEKAINPTGLHHILNQAFRFTALGGMETVAGQTQVGALNIYFAQLENHLPFSTHATQYLAQGKILHMVFGMPAAVFAIYKCALPQYREKVIRYFLPGVTAVILTGITEPIEFTYIFISPALWLINSVLAGLAFMIPAMFGAAIGNIQGGIIDWFVFGTLQGTSTKWYIYLFLGPMFAVTYYFIYSFIIKTYSVAVNFRNIIFIRWL